MDRRTAHPNRKISETFLHFAAPMLANLPRSLSEKRSKCLKVEWSSSLVTCCIKAWLPFVDAYRTFLQNPGAEGRWTFNQVEVRYAV